MITQDASEVAGRECEQAPSSGTRKPDEKVFRAPTIFSFLALHRTFCVLSQFGNELGGRSKRARREMAMDIVSGLSSSGKVLTLMPM